MNNDSYTGVQKAAILLITLGPEKAATIFKHLKEDEIEELTLEIANTRSVSPQTKEEVLEEFYQVCLAQQYIAEGGIGYAKELLEKALGNDKAQGVIAKLTASLQVRPFEFIRKTDPAQLLNLIINRAKCMKQGKSGRVLLIFCHCIFQIQHQRICSINIGIFNQSRLLCV